MTQVFDLQSIPVYKTQFDYSLLDEEKDLLFSCNLKHMSDNNNFFSENYYVLNHNSLNKLKSNIKNILDQYALEVFGIENCLDITQSWIAKTTPGGWHNLHNHPNSIVSCVLYLQTPPLSTIKFHYRNNISQNFNLAFDYVKFTKYNQSQFTLDVKEMDLVIFPSWLNHSVDINDSNIDRIVLSFNTFVFGELGKNYDYPLQLNLGQQQ